MSMSTAAVFKFTPAIPDLVFGLLLYRDNTGMCMKSNFEKT